MLHFTEKGIARIASPDFIGDIFAFVRKIEAPAEDIGWQLLVLIESGPHCG
jgi:hypothetical protein